MCASLQRWGHRMTKYSKKKQPWPLGSLGPITPIVAHQGFAPHLPCHYCQELDHACPSGTSRNPNTTPSCKGKWPPPYDTIPYRHATIPSGTAPQALPTTQWASAPYVFLSQSVIPNVCSYAHTCATYNSETHRAHDCSRTPMDSMF